LLTLLSAVSPLTKAFWTPGPSAAKAPRTSAAVPGKPVAGGAKQPGEAGLRGSAGLIVAVRRERAVLRAELQIVADVQVFLGEIGAHQPVQPVVEGRALQPELLAEGLELAEGVAVILAEQDVGAAIVDVARLLGAVVAIGGDRSQRSEADVPVDLPGKPPILGLAAEGAARSHRDHPAVRVVEAREGLAQAPEDVDDAVVLDLDPPVDILRLAVGGEGVGRRIGRLERREVDGAATGFVAGRIVADQPELEVVGRLVEQLAAHEQAVAVVDPALGSALRIVDPVISVALDIDAFHAIAEAAVADRPGEPAGDADEVVIAVARLGIALHLVHVGLFGDDVDQAGRCVAAEQGALRPAQHLDPFDLAELVQTDARARAVDSVDEHGDRAFEARIVADRADAADTGGAVRFGAGGGDQQGGRELVELADVGRARILHRFGVDRRHRDRHVLQDLLAALGGDDDVVAADFVGRRHVGIGIDLAGFLGRRGLAGRLGVVLGGGGRGEREQPGRHQPNGFHHASPPTNFVVWIRAKEKPPGPPAETRGFPHVHGALLHFRNN
jgi:hypothetical protein